MPFNMFKAFSGSRNRTHRGPGDPTIYNDYPQGYPPAEDVRTDPMLQSQSRVLRRPSTKRRKPIFTPLPSRTPTDAEDYNEGFVRVDSPDALMGGALNARPGKIDSAFPPLGPPLASPLSETLSEREHAERLHDVQRLPPPLQHAGSFHSGHGERLNPDEPIIMSPSQGGSTGSGSDHTIEALHTPPLRHPSERVIPPLPRNYSGRYIPGSRSPTDIYGNHTYEIVHDAHSRHNQEIYLDRYGDSGGYEKDSPIYYVIPGGMNVIFQDERGNEITRVGDFSGRSQPLRPGPFVVQDEHGRELYRYDSHGRGPHRGGYSEPQIVQIDTYPSSSHHRRDRSYSHQGYHSDTSYRRGHDYYPDHREHRDYRENEWRDRRDHRYRGYADYPNHSESRDHKGLRDPNRHRDYRDLGEYREHEYRPRERAEVYTPSRVPSRASHRTYSHTSQASLERLPHQYANSVSDDRRSGRDYVPMPQREDEVDISNGIQALHI